MNWKITWARLIGAMALICAVVISAGPTPAVGELTSDRAEIFRQANAYTVRLRTTIRFAFYGDRAGTFSGAGFLADRERGLVVTNAHVSGKSPATIKVAFKGQDFVPARVAYIDPEIDIAIIRIDPKSIPGWAIEASVDCTTNDISGLEVATFGHPKGLNFSATRGIVSRLAYSRGTERIQTDASINPGNSGGPLIDLTSGNVVGVNAAYLKESQGIGFAVPAHHLCTILNLIQQDRDPSPPDLGLEFASDNDRNRHLFVVAGRKPDIFNRFQPGDSIEMVNDKPVRNPTALSSALRGVSGAVDVLVRRGTKLVRTEMEVKPKPLITKRRGLLVDGALFSTDVYPERRHAERLLYVHSVKRGWPAASLGIKRFRRLLLADGQPVPKLDDFHRVLRDAGQDKKIQLVLRRLVMSKGNLYAHSVVYMHRPEVRWITFQ